MLEVIGELGASSICWESILGRECGGLKLYLPILQFLSFYKTREAATERSYLIDMQVSSPPTNQTNIGMLSLPDLPVGCGSLVWLLHADNRRCLPGFHGDAGD